MTSIDEKMFSGCTVLSSITIPENITYICPSAFADCRSLVAVTFENPNDWKVYRLNDGEREVLDVSLEYPWRNSEYLRETYVKYYWECVRLS